MALQASTTEASNTSGHHHASALEKSQSWSPQKLRRPQPARYLHSETERVPAALQPRDPWSPPPFVAEVEAQQQAAYGSSSPTGFEDAASDSGEEFYDAASPGALRDYDGTSGHSPTAAGGCHSRYRGYDDDDEVWFEDNEQEIYFDSSPRH